jgi:hypothetical protein
MIEQFPFPIQRVQTDRGTEFFAVEVQEKLMDDCIKFRPIMPRSPHFKGKVENSVNYVQENALKGRKFSSLQEQNEFLRYWEQNIADKRIHGTTKRQVEEMFAEEKPFFRLCRRLSMKYLRRYSARFIGMVMLRSKVRIIRFLRNTFAGKSGCVTPTR